jgi:hypothetical protein
MKNAPACWPGHFSAPLLTAPSSGLFIRPPPFQMTLIILTDFSFSLARPPPPPGIDNIFARFGVF